MLTKSEISNRIKTVGNQTAKVRKQIHEILVQCAGHAFEHGDVTKYTELFSATAGINRKRIAEWVRNHGLARLEKNGTFKLISSKRNAVSNSFESGDAYIEYLNEVPNWYEKEKDTEKSAEETIKELKVDARIDSLIKSINSKRYKVVISNKTAAMIEMLGRVVKNARGLEAASS